MTLIIKILIIAGVHMLFFAAYPETGPLGNYYLALSVLLWTGFMLFLNTSVKLVRLVSGLLGLALNLASFGLMGLAIAITMPQSDKTSVLEKIQARKYPDLVTLRAGMLRFGITLDADIKKDIKKLDGEVIRTIKKLKEN